MVNQLKLKAVQAKALKHIWPVRHRPLLEPGDKAYTIFNIITYAMLTLSMRFNHHLEKTGA